MKMSYLMQMERDLDYHYNQNMKKEMKLKKEKYLNMKMVIQHFPIIKKEAFDHMYGIKEGF